LFGWTLWPLSSFRILFGLGSLGLHDSRICQNLFLPKFTSFLTIFLRRKKLPKIQSKIVHGHSLSKLRTLKNTFWFQILTESHRITLIVSVRMVGNDEKHTYDDWQNLQKKTIFCPKKICRKGIVALISALAIFGLWVYCAHDKRNQRFTRTTIVFVSSTVRKAWNVVSQKFLINLNHFHTFF
jgi:hypothetical protein